jgi:hypothetical protein
MLCSKLFVMAIQVDSYQGNRVTGVRYVKSLFFRQQRLLWNLAAERNWGHSPSLPHQWTLING